MKMLPVIRTFLEALDEAKIPYVHWKSNEALARSADGRNDLDVLIDEDELDRFETLVSSLGFLAAETEPAKTIPGIKDFYGLDFGSTRLIHVHAHSRLVLGDDATKNYVFPFEDEYLESRRPCFDFSVPSAEWEYVVFVARMVLKHCPVDVVIGGRGRLTASEKRELKHLEAVADFDEVARLRAEYLPNVRPELWEAARSAISADADIVSRSRAGFHFQRAVAEFGARSPLRETIIRTWRRSIGPLTSWRSRPKRTPTTGGKFISVIGSDGSGKSTLVDGVATMLERDLWVVRGHLGKPPRSYITRALRRLARSVLSDVELKELTRPAWETPAPQQNVWFRAWHLSIARDRWREVARLQKLVARGAVVVTDRFPSINLDTMDCPRIAATNVSSKALASREERFYRRMGTPDLRLILMVPPDVAVARRPEQDQDFVARRANEVYRRNWDEPGVVMIDGQASIEDVKASALTTIWMLLTADKGSRPS